MYWHFYEFRKVLSVANRQQNPLATHQPTMFSARTAVALLGALLVAGRGADAVTLYMHAAQQIGAIPAAGPGQVRVIVGRATDLLEDGPLEAEFFFKLLASK